jgi:hypothetical protein
MTAGAYTPLDASVLVLNKLFMAVHVISVRRAFCLLAKELAEVVTLEEGQFMTYDFGTWTEVSEFRAKNFRQEEDDWVRTPTREIQAPRVIRLMSVLRQEVRAVGTEPRPRHAAQPGRADDVGEHRLRLRRLQRP